MRTIYVCTQVVREDHLARWLAKCCHRWFPQIMYACTFIISVVTEPPLYSQLVTHRRECCGQPMHANEEDD